MELRRADPSYPQRLLELRRPPAAVFVRGVLPPPSPSVAIVGARRASSQGRRLARTIARDVSIAGVTVVSGGALGVDIAAHLGALDAGRPTVVVLPTSLERPAPRENRRTFARVLETGGAWISEQNGPVGRYAFCSRNRLIAALADLVLVIEAGERSGTLHTIRAALALGRPIAAVPWSLDDPRGAGCVDLLRRSARAVTCAADVLAALGVEPPAEPEAGALGAMGPLDARVLAAVGRGATDPESISARTGAPLPEVLAALTALELEGAIALRGGRVERAR